MDEIVVSYRLEPRHMRAALLLTQGRKLALQGALGLFAIGLAIVYETGHNRGLFIALGFAVVCVALVSIIAPVWKAKRDPLWNADVEARISGSGLDLRGSDMRSTVPWRVIQRVLINREICVLFYGRVQFLAIPITSISDEERRRHLVPLLTEHVSKVLRRGGV